MTRASVREPFPLGSELRARRKAKGLTLAQVAEASGLSIAYISLVENGERSPNFAAVARIAAALGMRVELSEAGGAP